MSHKFETQAIRTQAEQSLHHEHSVPMYLTSSFTFDNAEHGKALFSGETPGNIYSRFSNPNSDELAQKMCALEGAEAGITTATGMAAVHNTLLALLSPGDHIVSSKAIFGNSLYVITNVLAKWGVSHTLVDINSEAEWESAIRPETKMIFVESPANPTLDIIDIEWLSALAKQHDIILSVDNCFATPYLQQPCKLGADLVIHSATKFIDGQGRVLGGIVAGKEELVVQVYEFLRRTGPSISPFNAWVLSKSLETLHVRMDRHCQNALKLAEYLESHPAIERVIYPHLPSYYKYELAKKQMRLGGGLVACFIKGPDAGRRGSHFLNSLKLFSLTANLGDTRSIATHPASTTHSKLSEEERQAAGVLPGLIRFSVGLEHIDDIIQDVEQSLNKKL